MLEAGSGGRPRIAPGQKVLLVRSAYIGDFLVCVPFIRSLMEVVPLRREDVRFLIINDSGANPVSMIFGEGFFGADAVRIVSPRPGRALASAASLRRWLRDVDHVLYLPFAGEAPRLRLKKWGFLKVLTGLFRPIHGTGRQPGEPSQVLALFDQFGLPRPAPGNDLAFLRLDGASDKVEAVLGSDHRPVRIALYPNSKLSMKVWPRERYVALARELLAAYDCSIFLVGDKADAAYNATVAKDLPPESVRDVAGTLSIRETVQFLSRMSVLVGNDGSPLHMAALAGTPMVGLYTYKAPVGQWDPGWADRIVTLRADVACRECARVACADPTCLTSIPVGEVVRAVRSVLSGPHPRDLRVLRGAARSGA